MVISSFRVNIIEWIEWKKYGWNMGEILMEYGRNMARIWVEFMLNMGKIWVEYG